MLGKSRELVIPGAHLLPYIVDGGSSPAEAGRLVLSGAYCPLTDKGRNEDGGGGGGGSGTDCMRCGSSCCGTGERTCQPSSSHTQADRMR